jgi:predicted Zn-dependent protease
MDDNKLYRLVPILLGALAIGFFALRGCQKGPFGRPQLVAIKGEQEKALGAQAYEEVVRKSNPLKDSPIVDAVKDVTRRLTNATSDRNFLKLTKLKLEDYDWEVSVVRSKEVNAFCLPGGKMVVYTGILPVCATNAGLATVMGHEISHALAHHGAERMAQEQLVQLGVAAAGSSLRGLAPGERERVMRALNAGAQFGILKYSRRHESEADHLGLLLMAAAGYNPNEAVKFWTRMQRQSEGASRPPEFLSTHPSHETRIRDLNRWLPEAMKLYQDNPARVPTKELPLPESRSSAPSRLPAAQGTATVRK